MRPNRNFLNFDFAYPKNQDILTKQYPLNQEYIKLQYSERTNLISVVVNFKSNIESQCPIHLCTFFIGNRLNYR